MGLGLVTLEAKKKGETVPYQLDLKENSAFEKLGEVIASKAFAIFKIEDSAADDLGATGDLSGTMVYATSHLGSVVQCDVMLGDIGQTYVLWVRVTCVSGRKYEAQGAFTILPNWS